VSNTTYKGIVEGGAVVLAAEIDFPEGTEVLVAPLNAPNESPQAVLVGHDGGGFSPHLNPPPPERRR
jgi:hypothetical protein